MPARASFELDRTPGRRLRVGYVSPDFRQHAVALFAEPLLAAHDRAAVELFCYAEVPAPDAVTATVPRAGGSLAQHRRAQRRGPGRNRSASDRIDVLVDLAGHTAGNRLLAFARKPAPVQIAYLLGHGYSTGLSAMDALPGRRQTGARGCRCAVQRAADPAAAHSTGLSRRRPPCRRSRHCRHWPTAASRSAISAARCG